MDDFEDGIIGAAWIVEEPSITSEAGGELQFAVSMPIGPFPDVWSQQGYDLSNGWFRVELAQLSNSFRVQQEISIFPMDEEDDTLKLLLENPRLMARWAPAVGGFNNVGEIVFDPDQHRWFGLRGEGDMLHFETSPDGVTFMPFVSYVSPFSLTEVRISIGGGNWSMIDMPTVVSFEQVQVCTSPP